MTGREILGLLAANARCAREQVQGYEIMRAALRALRQVSHSLCESQAVPPRYVEYLGRQV